MAFDWREYLTLARDLQAGRASSVSQEAIDRCTISRAYYAAFGRARNFAELRLGFPEMEEADVHGKLIRHLRPRRTWGHVATKLAALRLWRDQCDYDAELPEDIRRMVEATLEQA